MYLQNKYTNWYNNIIAKAQLRVNHTGYTETHHIIPKSMGGSNDQSNLVKLTAREHFICHRLLVKMTQGESNRKMKYALWAIINLKNGNQNRIKVNSKTYALVREEWVKSRKGLPGPNLGKKMPLSTREKLSAQKKGKPLGPMSEEHRKKMMKPKSAEHKRKISEAMKGKSWGHRHSEQTKQKMSEWQKGVKKPKVKCEFCEKETSLMNYKKWHSNNCKFK